MFLSSVVLHPAVGVVDLYTSVILPIEVQVSSLKVFMVFHYSALCCEA